VRNLRLDSRLASRALTGTAVSALSVVLLAKRYCLQSACGIDIAITQGRE
jgi:hypothetical protein